MKIEGSQDNRKTNNPDRVDELTQKETQDDIIFYLSLRPKRFADFVGQIDAVDNLKMGLTAAKQRSEPLEHTLLYGPPGLGKTSLAHIIANEMDSKITSTSGPAIERAGDLIGILTNLERGDILFIDEIHRISKVVEEYLYTAMENFQIDFIIDKGPYAKTIKFNLKPFTLIGATTRSGLLGAPLRGRFGIFYHLDFYKEEELAEIIRRSADVLGVKIDNDASFELARRSRGTPRIANRILRRVRDFVQVKELPGISVEIADKALSALGIDKAGLDGIDCKVLKTLIDVYDGGPVGIESLAATLNEEQDIIVDVIEPYLLKAGFLKRTKRGREVAELAYKHFGLENKKIKQKELF